MHGFYYFFMICDGDSKLFNDVTDQTGCTKAYAYRENIFNTGK